MSKLLKKRMARELCQDLAKVDSFIMFNFNKMNTYQAYSLRKYLHERNMRVRVVKNNIAAVAFSELYHNRMESVLKGPTAIAYGGESPVEVAKTLIEWNKKEKAIEIKGGFLSSRVINKKEVDSLSKMPGRPVLLAGLAGTIKAPVSTVATVLTAPLRNLACTFQSLKEKKEKEGTLPSPAGQ